MLFMIIYLFSVISAIGLGIVAGWSDYRGMTIPNYVVALVVAVFPVAWAAAHFSGAGFIAPLQSHLIAFVIVLAVSYLMFARKLIGGGDSKLVSAYALWFGGQGIAVFLFYMLLSGAVFGLLALYLKKKKPFKAPREGGWVARVQGGEGVVPYGIPIAFGAIAAFAMQGFLSPETLALFLVQE